MLYEEVKKFEKLSGMKADDCSISYVGGYLDGYSKATPIVLKMTMHLTDEDLKAFQKVWEETTRKGYGILPLGIDVANPNQIKGKWTTIHREGCGEVICSVCGMSGEDCEGTPQNYNFCPYCGADMRGDVDDG